MCPTTDCDKPEATCPQQYFFLLYCKNSSADRVSEDILDKEVAEQLQIYLNPTMFFRSFQKRLVVSEASDLHQEARIKSYENQKKHNAQLPECIAPLPNRPRGRVQSSGIN